MWILRGSSAPDHNTVARFISSCKIEIEDNANKYTFVWKKAINKFYEKLKIKVNNLRYSFNENNNTEFNDIYEIREHLEKEILDRDIEFVS